MRGCIALPLLLAVLAVAPPVAAETVYVSYTAKGLPVYSNRPTRQGAQLVTQFAEPRVRASTRARTSRPGMRTRSVSVDSSVDALIRLAALSHDMEEALLRAVIDVESRFNPKARSSRGAMGLMQLMPGTARRFGVRDAYDPMQNIDGGTRYLKELLRMFAGDVRLALAAYNAGEGAVLRHGRRIPPFAETQAYVVAVLSRYHDYRAALTRQR